MNEFIRKHSDLSNSIIKKGQSYFQSSENSKSDSKLTFMTLCFLGHLTYLGDALTPLYLPAPILQKSDFFINLCTSLRHTNTNLSFLYSLPLLACGNILEIIQGTSYWMTCQDRQIIMESVDNLLIGLRPHLDYSWDYFRWLP